MSIKDAKPGRYKPKCSKCGIRFLLTIFAETDRAPFAEPLPSETPTGTGSPNTSSDKTVPAAAPVSSKATAATEATLPAAPHAAATLPAVNVKSMEATTPAPAVDATIAAMPPSKPIERSSSPKVASAKTQADSIEATVAAAAGKSGSGTEATVVAVDRTAAGDSGGTRKPATATDVPERIGGYKIVKELGRGAMGAVYLAKQLSLDRDVALKTIQAQWATHPTFIARFTREAYAAAQLTHHNVVQIYDLGSDRGTNYFSMEFVRGESLDDLIKRNGPMSPESAVGFILQAARGLQFAHSHGMVHRDVKPANMMINDLGVVKIADLGLVKVAMTGTNGDEPSSASASDASALKSAGADVTLANVAMGTPAYMAPEQADNAAGVDHRADIYSLGCSLYVLLTGKPPFEGASAIEVITKHRTANVVRPDMLVAGLPKELADITLKMVAKQPEQRYQNLGDVIRDLEKFLGGGGDSKIGPTDDQAALIGRESKHFHDSALAKLRGVIGAGFLGLCGLLFLALLFLSWSMAGAIACLALSAFLAYFVVNGITTHSPLFERVRSLMFAARWTDWLTWLVGGLIGLFAIWLIGWLWLCLAGSLIGIGLGIAYSLVIDRRLARQRNSSVEAIQDLLRTLRVKGMDEGALQLFVAQYSGANWEELFETLFGYEAKLPMRAHLTQAAPGSRHKFRAWREPILRRLDERLAADRAERDRRHLEKLEEQNLRSQGIDPEQARQQAGRIAGALVEDAVAGRVPATQRPVASADPAVAAAEKRERIKRMLAEAKAGATEPKKSNLLATVFAPARLALSGKVRFLLGCLLLGGCGLWARQNNLVSEEKLKSVTSGVSQSLKASDVTNLTQTIKLQKAEPLHVPVVGRFFDSWYPGIAGAMLVVLGLFRGWKMSLFAIPAAACIVLGPAFAPPVVMLLAGLVVGAVGLVFGRSGST